MHGCGSRWTFFSDFSQTFHTASTDVPQMFPSQNAHLATDSWYIDQNLDRLGQALWEI